MGADSGRGRRGHRSWHLPVSHRDRCSYKKFDVARVTVRKAMGQLRAQGLITTKPGKGSIVSRPNGAGD
ncbi:hypothetical protein Mro03_51500 [Microbispora rosea subsp. rosea]|nr:hypothetical protein Mro03_51500 [Microbispora rosea subsp. rosea]